RAQIMECAAALNAEGIAPVLLKTVVNLVERPDAAIGTWTTRDIDLVVEPERFDRSLEIITSLGYRTRPELKCEDGHSHPGLVRPGSVVPIDLHKSIGPQLHILSTSEALAEAKALGTGGAEIRTLSSTHQMIHVVFHSEVDDRRHELGLIGLHPLINF